MLAMPSHSESHHVRFVVRFTGNVQGVGFRATVLQQAADLDVHGEVRNEPDGSVQLDADGGRAELKTLLDRVKSVMSHHIDSADVNEQPSRGRKSGLRIGG